MTLCNRKIGMFFRFRDKAGEKIPNLKHVFLQMILYCVSNYMALSRNWSLLQRKQRNVLIPPAPVVQFPASITLGRRLLRAGKWSSSAVVRRVRVVCWRCEEYFSVFILPLLIGQTESRGTLRTFQRGFLL